MLYKAGVANAGQEALNTLNEFRRFRFPLNYQNENITDPEKLITFIHNERRRELCFEDHRWFDLRRTTRPEIKKEIEDVTYTLVQDDSRYTLRIPQDAIDANPGLLN